MVFGSRSGLLVGHASRPLLATRIPIAHHRAFTTFGSHASTSLREGPMYAKAQSRGFADQPAASVEEAKKVAATASLPAAEAPAKPKSSVGSR